MRNDAGSNRSNNNLLMHKVTRKTGNVQRLNSVERSVIRNVRKNVTKSAISPWCQLVKMNVAKLTVKGTKQKNAIVRKIRKKQHQRKCKKSSFDFKKRSPQKKNEAIFFISSFFYLGNIKTPCANSACHSVQLPRIGFCHEGNRVSWQLLVLWMRSHRLCLLDRYTTLFVIQKS